MLSSDFASSNELNFVSTKNSFLWSFSYIFLFFKAISILYVETAFFLWHLNILFKVVLSFYPLYGYRSN